MNILKLLRDVFARVKAISVRVRSTICNATASRPVPAAGTPSPQTLAAPLESYPTRSAEVVDPTHSSENAEHASNAAGESSDLDSTSSHGLVEPHSLEGMGPTGEFPLPLGTPPPAAIVSETDQHAISDHSPPVTTAVERRRSVKRRRRPRKPYTLQLDFSQYTEISDNEVDEFRRCSELGTLDTVVDLTALRLDALLWRALNGVRLIGELPISDTAFRQIAEVMRDAYLIRGRPNISKIPPALFITSMVFCARYSEEEVRNFWTPYARLVWELPEASLTFQNRCRKHFEACRKHLAQWFGFAFPIIEGQARSVVRPVYHHAVIPYYLEDAFATWIVRSLENLHHLIAVYGPEALPTLLIDEPSLNRFPPSLRSFILGETSATAATLITQLSEAATVYLSDEEDVAYLISSPIERALWLKVQGYLDDKIENERMRRGPQPVLIWGWLLDEAELQLRLAHVSGRDGVPDMCVWAEKGETALSESDHYAVLGEYLWRNRDGWSLDEVRLSGGPFDGQIAVLSDEHEDDRPDVLLRKEVPPLPSSTILFARESRQGWATFVGPERVTDGDWLISIAEGVALWDEDGNPIAPYEKEYVPDLLREHSAHVTAGWYALRLPVIVTQDGEPLFTIERASKQIGVPVLEGPCLLPNLSSRIPPVFNGLPVTLRIPGMANDNDMLSHTTLSIHSAIYSKLSHLDELKTDGVLSMPAYGDCAIALDTLFPGEAGVYTLNLRRGLKSLLDEPLQFSYLPGVEVQAPEHDRHYSPAYLPDARLFGVAIEQVVVDAMRARREPIDGVVQVIWHDLRTPECSLRVEISDQTISLAWPIRRTYAWVDSLADDGTLRAKDRDAATIHIRGNRYQHITWRVGGASEREVRIDAKGVLDFALSHDAPLLDMIEKRHETHVPVEIVAGGAAWTLFEYVRTPDLSVQRVAYDAAIRQLVLECLAGHVYQGDFRLQVQKANAPVDEPEFIADFERLKEEHVFGCELTPGEYSVEILSSDEQIHVQPLHVAFAPMRGEDATALTPRRPDRRKSREIQRFPIMQWTQVESRRRRIEIPQFLWCAVPAGCFVMGGDPDAEGAWPGCEFDLPYQFWILKYPVTVAQFAVFVEQDGYNNYEYWQSGCWGKKGKPSKLEGRGSLRDECPITKVSWCEAFAFANWLDNELPKLKPPDAPDGYVIRLARECEWEKAARYPDGRLFPWGDEWDATRLNWGGSRSKRLRPVGSFPAGAHPELGICDLLGTVSEWCLTTWREKYVSPEAENNIGKADDERCIRGGSWRTKNLNRLRTAARVKAGPRYRSRYLGFRLVVSKPVLWLK